MDEGHSATTALTTSTAAPRPLRRDAERNRQLIIAAARALFAERGLAASLEDVARGAGVGVGTLYRHFPNREALIDALFADALDTIGRIVDDAVAMPRAWDGLRHFMVSLLELQARDKGLRDVLLPQRPHDRAEDLLRERIKPPLEALVRRAKDEGDLRADMVAADVSVLEVAAVGAAEFVAAAGPEAWRRYMTIVFDGMRARPEGGNTRLEQPAMDDDQLEVCFAGWKYGSRRIPRQH
jgi:AcrR family transcriptional regulator